MATIQKPKEGEDVRLLHNNVSELIKGINAVTNMTARLEGRVRGIGGLSLKSGSSEIYIKASDPGEFGTPAKRAAIVVVGSAPNPSDHNQLVTFSATVVGATSGTIAFSIDGVNKGVFNVVNQGASFQDSTLAPGSHLVRADFSGDVNLLAGFGVSTHVVNSLPSPNMTLSSSKNPSDQGDSINWGANLSGNTTPLPTGTVRFLIDGAQFGAPGTLASGLAVSAINTDLQPGHHTIEADYSGDTNWGQTFRTLDQVVRANVLIQLAIQPDPANDSQQIDFYIQVSGYFGIPTGTIVLIKDGAVWTSPVTLDASGQAHLTLASMPAGEYDITCAYSGDGTYAANTSAVVHLSVHVSYLLQMVAWQVSWLSSQIFLNFQLSVYNGNYPGGTVTIAAYDTPVLVLYDVNNNYIGTYGASNCYYSGYNTHNWDLLISHAFDTFFAQPPTTNFWTIQVQIPNVAWFYADLARLRLSFLDAAGQPIIQANGYPYAEIAARMPRP